MGKMALALESGGSIPWQGKGWGSDGTTILDGSLMTSLKIPNACPHPLTQQFHLCKGTYAQGGSVQSVRDSRRLAAAHAHQYKSLLKGRRQLYAVTAQNDLQGYY